MVSEREDIIARINDEIAQLQVAREIVHMQITAMRSLKEDLDKCIQRILEFNKLMGGDD